MRSMGFGSVLIGCLLVSGAALADVGGPRFAPQESVSEGAARDGLVGRCGVKELTADEAEAVELQADALFRSQGYPEQMVGVDIPVAFHVISAGDSLADGNVPESLLMAQLDTLNAAYADLGITFSLHSIDRTENTQWYKLYPGTPTEKEAKAALVVDPEHTFNVYTAAPRFGLLGWSSLPWGLLYNPENDGVVIHHGSVPGSFLVNYNEGDTLVHEAGHWLGLFHTFYGGCVGPGDRVDDTAPERTATSGCPATKDTCAGGGSDPIENFMDYSYDECINTFTPGQGDRAFMMSGLFRSGLF